MRLQRLLIKANEGEVDLMVDIKLKPDKSAFIRKATLRVVANISTQAMSRMFIMEQRRYNLGDSQSKLNAEQNAINCILNKARKENGTINQLKVGKDYYYGYHYVDRTSNRWA